MEPPTDQARPAGPLHVLLLVAAGLVAALYLSWRTLAAADFLYPQFYDLAGIGLHIDTYGPKNRYKTGFGDTTRTERERLFAAIAGSVRNHGRGLESLTYHDGQGRRLGILLRSPEIVHLRDVARLVHRLEIAGLLALATLAFQIVLLRRKGLRTPGTGRLLASTLGAVLAVGIVIVLAGPRKVFYSLHEAVFPPDHQWFFYYQESLMSTMMKAPYLFGYIAVALIVLAILYLWALFLAAAAATRRRGQPAP